LSFIVVIDTEGVEHKLDAPDGWRVMEIVRDHGLKMEGLCGGACACATCHVEVDDAWADRIPGRSDDEEAALDTLPDVGPRSRLCCQILFSEEIAGLRVALKPPADEA
jgi:2Fe-2S ferredoxin